MHNLVSNYWYAVVVAAITYALLAATIAAAQNTTPVTPGVSPPERVIPQIPADSKPRSDSGPRKAESKASRGSADKTPTPSNTGTLGSREPFSYGTTGPGNNRRKSESSRSTGMDGTSGPSGAVSNSTR